MSKATTMTRRSPEEMDVIRRETRWVPVEEPPTLTREDVRAIGHDGQTCPHCYGNRFATLDARGETTGVTLPNIVSVRCPCRYVLWLWSDWRSVPERFRDVTWGSLTPRGKQQTVILDLIRSHPHDSYYLYGPPGTGKTHFSFAMYHRALVGSLSDADDPHYVKHVWRVTTSVLLNQHVSAETDKDAPIPVVTERMIAAAAGRGLRPVLFLDEIDKFPPSEFKLGRLGEIVDAVYATKGQIVATANKDWRGLDKKWGDSDVVGTILRRIGSDGGHTLDFGESKIAAI